MSQLVKAETASLSSFFKKRQQMMDWLDRKPAPLMMEIPLQFRSGQRMRQRARRAESRRLNPRATSREMAVAQKIVRTLKDGNGNLPNISLVASFDDLPTDIKAEFWSMKHEDGEAIRGFFVDSRPERGVWIVVGSNRNVTSFSGKRLTLEQAIAETYWHEVVGHFGIRGLLGGDINLRLHTTAIAASMPQAVERFSRRLNGKPYASLDEDMQQRTVEEFVAYMAGDILAGRTTLNDEQRSIWERFLFWVRSKLASMGYHRFMTGPLAFTNRDIQHMIARAEDHVRNGKAWTYQFRDGRTFGMPRLMRDSEILYSTVDDMLSGDYARKLSKADRKQRVAAGKPPHKPLFEAEDTFAGFSESLTYAKSVGLIPMDGGETRPLSKTGVEASGLPGLFERGSYADVLSVYPEMALPNPEQVERALQSAEEQLKKLDAETAADAQQEDFLRGHINALRNQLNSPMVKLARQHKELRDAAIKATDELAALDSDQEQKFRRQRRLALKRAARNAVAKLRSFENQLYNQRIVDSPLLKDVKWPRDLLNKWFDQHGLRVSVAYESQYHMNEDALREMLRQHFNGEQIDNIINEIKRDIRQPKEKGAVDIGKGAYGLPAPLLPNAASIQSLRARPASDQDPHEFTFNKATNELTVKINPARAGVFRMDAQNRSKGDNWPIVGGTAVGVGLGYETLDAAPELAAAIQGLAAQWPGGLNSTRWAVKSSDVQSGTVVLMPMESGLRMQDVAELPDNVPIRFKGEFNLSWNNPIVYGGGEWSNHGMHTKEDLGMDSSAYHTLLVLTKRGDETFTSYRLISSRAHFYGSGIDKNIQAHIRIAAAYPADLEYRTGGEQGRSFMYVVEVQQEHAQVGRVFSSQIEAQSIEQELMALVPLMDNVAHESMRSALMPAIDKIIDDSLALLEIEPDSEIGSTGLSDRLSRSTNSTVEAAVSLADAISEALESLATRRFVAQQPSGKREGSDSTPPFPWQRGYFDEDVRMPEFVGWRGVYGYAMGMRSAIRSMVNVLEDSYANDMMLREMQSNYNLENNTVKVGEESVSPKEFVARKIRAAAEHAFKFEYPIADVSYRARKVSPASRALYDKTLLQDLLVSELPKVLEAKGMGGVASMLGAATALNVEEISQPEIIEVALDQDIIEQQIDRPGVVEDAAQKLAAHLNTETGANFVLSYRKEPVRFAEEKGAHMTYRMVPSLVAHLPTTMSKEARADAVRKTREEVARAGAGLVASATGISAGQDMSQRDWSEIERMVADSGVRIRWNRPGSDHVQGGWVYYPDVEPWVVAGASASYDVGDFKNEDDIDIVRYIADNVSSSNFEADDSTFRARGAYRGSDEFVEARNEAYNDYVESLDDPDDADDIDDWEWDDEQTWIDDRREEINDELRTEADEYETGEIWDQMVEQARDEVDGDPPYFVEFELEGDGGEAFTIEFQYNGAYVTGDTWRYNVWIDDNLEVQTDDESEYVNSFASALHRTIGASNLPDYFRALGQPQTQRAGRDRPVGEIAPYTQQAERKRLRRALSVRHYKSLSQAPFSDGLPEVRGEKIGFSAAYERMVELYKTLARKSGGRTVTRTDPESGTPEPPLSTEQGYEAVAYTVLADAARLGYPGVMWGGAEETVYRGGLGPTRDGGFPVRNIDWERDTYVGLDGKTKNVAHLTLDTGGYDGIFKLSVDMGNEDAQPSSRLVQLFNLTVAKELHDQFFGKKTGQALSPVGITPQTPSRDDLRIQRVGSQWAVINAARNRLMGAYQTEAEANRWADSATQGAIQRGYWFDQAERAEVPPSQQESDRPVSGGRVTEVDVGGRIAVTPGGGNYSMPYSHEDRVLQNFRPTMGLANKFVGARLNYDRWFVSAMQKAARALDPEAKVVKSVRLSSRAAARQHRENYILTLADEGAAAAFEQKFGKIEIVQLQGLREWVIASEKRGIIGSPFTYLNDAQQELARFRESEMQSMIDMKELAEKAGVREDQVAVAMVWQVELTDTMREKLQGGVGLMNRSLGSDPMLAAIAKKIGAKKKPLRQRYQEMTTRWKDHFIQGMFDKFHGLKAALRDAGLGSLRAEDDPYVQARLTTSLDSVMRAVMDYGHPVWKEGIVQSEGRGLMEILQPVASQLDLWGMYMAGVRALRLRAEGRERLFTDAEIARMVQLGDENPHFKTVAKDYAEFNRRVLDFAEQAGVINPDTRALWEHADYVPFYRIADDRIQGPLGRNIGIAGVKNPVKVLKGGEQNVGDIVQNIMINITNLVDSAMKNHAAVMAVDALDGAGLINKMPWRFEAELVPMNQVEKVLRQHGMNPA
ncbi:MAG: hypothetical protein V2I45_10565, partial [Halieaceae bacterium]|nr:hypothetical protein [Halieaceae bacterium]